MVDLHPSKGSLKPAAKPVDNRSPVQIELDSMIDSMNPCQKKAFNALCDGENIFLTGFGGSGKTFVCRAFILWCLINGKSVGKMAPTGIAALNFDGVTMHRAFKLPIHYSPSFKNRKVSFDVIIIDELSMARADTFTHAERSMSGDTGIPWGGAQFFGLGDFYQIAPVVRADERVINSQNDAATISVRNALKQDFGGVYCFETDAWEQSRIEVHELLTNNRVKADNEDDIEYARVLDKVRIGTATQQDLRIFNRNILPEPPANSVVVCFTNKTADEINEQRMEEIKSKQYVSEMEVKNERKIKESDYCVPKTLKLKAGAKVMLQINDKNERFKNGSIGVVTDVEEGAVYVRLTTQGENEEPLKITKNEWEVQDIVDCYKVPNKDGEGHTMIPCDDMAEVEIENLEDATVYNTQCKVASYKQYPIKLAWACTAHKMQGQTITEPLHIMMDGKIRSHGLFYVAASRATTVANLSVGKLVRVRDIVVDPVVSRFMSGTEAIQVPVYALNRFEDLVKVFNGIQESKAEDCDKEAVLEQIDARIAAWVKALKTLK